jgi:hypothetical protein
MSRESDIRGPFEAGGGGRLFTGPEVESSGVDFLIESELREVHHPLQHYGGLSFYREV